MPHPPIRTKVYLLQEPRRTEVYVLRPAQYEIAGCECGNQDPDWSEFKGHLWCQKCQKDFKPVQNGVFDGPIPINTAHLLWLCFATVNIESGELTKCCETCETEVWDLRCKSGNKFRLEE